MYFHSSLNFFFAPNQLKNDVPVYDNVLHVLQSLFIP